MQVEPAPISCIDFRKPKRGSETDEQLTTGTCSTSTCSAANNVPPLTKHEEENFFKTLKEILPTSAILSMVYEQDSGSTSGTVNRRLVRKLPTPLLHLKDPKYEKMAESELTSACEKAFNDLKVTEDEAKYLEESTKLQSQCLLWHTHRGGRITASRFSAVSRANWAKPPMSLVKQIMSVTNINSMKVPALQWGITNEPKACAKYVESATELHEGFSFQPAGLFVNTALPHLGASPDGLVSCRCCGDGLIEIKCPYKHRDKNPAEVNDKDFCLQPSDNGDIQLSRTHPYYTHASTGSACYM